MVVYDFKGKKHIERYQISYLKIVVCASRVKVRLNLEVVFYEFLPSLFQHPCGDVSSENSFPISPANYANFF